MMKSRDIILRDIAAAQIPQVDHPGHHDHSDRIRERLQERFKKEVTSAGGELFQVAYPREITEILCRDTPLAHSWCNIEGIDLPGNIVHRNASKEELEKLEIVVLPASLGVAENGAVWIDDKAMTPRVLPFITTHLAVVMSEHTLVENLNVAYRLLDKEDYAFGMLLGGPSKTADIEQSLVLGAHGPERYTLFLSSWQSRDRKFMHIPTI